jgi:transcription elongation factor GreA-like protein
MEPITLTAIAVFLAPYFKKAGEKIADKTVETLFNSHEELAQKFKGLFKDEITTLNLSDSASVAEINKQLEETPQIKEEISKKVADNQPLLNELVTAFQKMPQPEFSGISINAKNIGQIINNPAGSINQTNTFS